MKWFSRITGIEKLIVIVIALLISLGAFYALDYGLGDTHHDKGSVTGKKYSPAYTSIYYTKVGDISIPNTQYHPERWHVSVDVYGDVISCTAYESQYKISEYGDKVNVTYSKGWISDGKYCESFSAIKKDDYYR